MTITWTLDRIRAHCDECDDCLLWRGGLLGKQYPYAKEWLDARGKQQQIYVRRRVWELSTGKPAPKGSTVITISCDNPRCVAYPHLVAMSRSKRLKQAASSGVFQSLAFRAKVSAARTRDSDLTDEDVAAIRSSEELGRVLAEQHNISVGYACALKAGQARPDYRNPFAALQVLQKGKRP